MNYIAFAQLWLFVLAVFTIAYTIRMAVRGRVKAILILPFWVWGVHSMFFYGIVDFWPAAQNALHVIDPFFFSQWSAILRLHEVFTLLYAIYLIKLEHLKYGKT